MLKRYIINVGENGWIGDSGPATAGTASGVSLPDSNAAKDEVLH